MLRGVLTILTFLVATTVLGIVAIVTGLVTGRRTVIFRLGRLWAKAHLKVMGIEPEYVGLEHAAGTAPRVFLANHASNLDIWVLGSRAPDHDTVRLQADDLLDPRAGSSDGARRLHRNRPEGSRQRDPQSRPGGGEGQEKALRSSCSPKEREVATAGSRRFKRGAFHLALQAGVPVVPISISGSYDVLKPRSIVVRPGPVSVTFGAPIDVAPYANDLDGLMERVRADIGAALTPEERTAAADEPLAIISPR